MPKTKNSPEPVDHDEATVTSKSLKALRKKVVYSLKPLTFRVTPRDVAMAKCGDETQCVIAQVFRRLFPDTVLDQMRVSSWRAAFVFSDQIVVFKMPGILRNALREFDRTGQWNIPLNKDYHLLPSPQRRSRHRMIDGKKNGKLNKSGKAILVLERNPRSPNIHTRIITRVDSIACGKSKSK